MSLLRAQGSLAERGASALWRTLPCGTTAIPAHAIRRRETGSALLHRFQGSEPADEAPTTTDHRMKRQTLCILNPPRIANLISPNRNLSSRNLPFRHPFGGIASLPRQVARAKESFAPKSLRDTMSALSFFGRVRRIRGLVRKPLGSLDASHMFAIPCQWLSHLNSA
jgi:hypothetical protein